MDTLDVKLLRQRIGQKRVHQSIKPLYADHAWAKDLDIINELGGHTGCVNALRSVLWCDESILNLTIQQLVDKW